MKNLLSDELFNAIEVMKWDFVDGKKLPTGHKSTQWTHLQDAVEKGSISPMEAYDSVRLGYLPEGLKVRDSKYSHLI